MNPLLTSLKLLGINFYQKPDNSNQEIRAQLSQLTDLIDWPNARQIQQWLDILSTQNNVTELEYQFSVLFEGQGEMECPPWGSVYLDKNNLVFGESTHQYRNFLAQNGLQTELTMKEPEDQFGLMLLALSQLLEQQQHQAATELLTEHLLPWGFRYLELLSSNEISPFYANLANITTSLLNHLQQEFALKVKVMQLHF